MGSKPSTPPPRNYYDEMKSAMDSQYKLVPEIISKEADIIPQLQKLQNQQMTAQAANLKSFYGSVMGDSADLLKQYGSTYTDALAPIARGSRSAYEQSLGGGATLQNMMRERAASDLSAGTSLTPEMERNAQQMARAAASARGLANTNRGIGAEVLGGYNMGLQREDRARAFSNAVLGNDMNMAGQAYQQYGAGLTQLGLSSLTPMGMAQSSMAGLSTLGPSYLQPESQYNANILGGNQNMYMQGQVAGAQSNNAMIGAGATVAAAMI